MWFRTDGNLPGEKEKLVRDIKGRHNWSNLFSKIQYKSGNWLDKERKVRTVSFFEVFI